MFDNNEEMFPIVDEEGNITGAATRKECHSGSKLLHPVVHLHVFNDKGELYLQKRPAWKDIQPNKWDTSVGGHIDLGESVEMALKERLKKNSAFPTLLSNCLHIMFLSRTEKKNWYSAIVLFITEKSLPATNLTEGVSGQ